MREKAPVLPMVVENPDTSKSKRLGRALKMARRIADDIYLRSGGDLRRSEGRVTDLEYQLILTHGHMIDV